MYPWWLTIFLLHAYSIFEVAASPTAVFVVVQWYLSCTTTRRSDKCGRKRQVVVDHRFAIAECFLPIH